MDVRSSPEVFGTDQLEIQTPSVPSVSFPPMVCHLHGHSCHGAKSTQGCDVFPRFSHSFLALNTPTLRYNSPFVDLQRPVSGYSLDQRRYLAFQHVAWPLCRQLAASEDSEMARRGGFAMMRKKCNVAKAERAPCAQWAQMYLMYSNLMLARLFFAGEPCVSSISAPDALQHVSSHDNVFDRMGFQGEFLFNRR